MAKRFRITRGNDAHQPFKKTVVEKDPGDDFEPDAEEPEDEIPAEFDPKKRKVETKVEAKKVVEPVVRRVVVPPPPTRKVAPKVEEPADGDDNLVEEKIEVITYKQAEFDFEKGKVVLAKPDEVSDSDLTCMLLKALETGNSLVFTKLDTGKWNVMMVDGKAEKQKPVEVHAEYNEYAEKAFVDELAKLQKAKPAKPSKNNGKTLNPEYEKWEQEWKALSFEQKCAKAKKAGVKWDKHANQMRENINLTMAYRKHLGIEKYL